MSELLCAVLVLVQWKMNRSAWRFLVLLSRSCLDAYASLLYHSEGQDLEAHAFDYEVTSWGDQQLVVINRGGMGECLDRILQVDLVGEGATLEWRPGADECQVDSGKAVLVGDPL